ncbi:Basic helix-loop-helix DNA-binding superfamily protein [Hibiscus syriacus]|uniref:Basic helix-loop-helix DNA-binding superfamily protein n=1 Tax=Hibiscus syriacus TaxID=106335 RepID=A0A6A3B8S4_HIBSY|nr:mavicyanin-like [Hibiscus syriacus]KAE8711785.1 Basic helix-loop-helix DNA-binding superfamily protein [Hibiscus syriacus]
MARKMAVQGALLGFFAATEIVFQLAMAVDHTVGAPNGGWDTSTDLATWAGSQSFAVGDNLVFRYTSNHDVVEVTQTNYDSCSTINSIGTHTGGNTVIALSSPGKRYFICGIPGHCNQGMKVEIDTLASSGTPPGSTPGTPSSPEVPSAESPGSSPPPPPPASSNGVGLKACLAVGFGPFGLMLMMLLAI